MTAQDALEQQIRGYRQMSGEQRVAVALELHELACAIAREGIRHRHPLASPLEVEDLLHQRLKLAHS